VSMKIFTRTLPEPGRIIRHTGAGALLSGIILDKWMESLWLLVIEFDKHMPTQACAVLQSPLPVGEG